MISIEIVKKLEQADIRSKVIKKSDLVDFSYSGNILDLHEKCQETLAIETKKHHEQGYSLGYDLGKKEGFQKIIEEFALFQQHTEQRVQFIKDNVSRLIASSIKKVLKNIPSDELLGSVLDDIIDEVGGLTQAVIKVSPCVGKGQLAPIRECVSKLLISARVVIDPDVSDGEILIESDQGIYHFSIDCFVDAIAYEEDEKH